MVNSLLSDRVFMCALFNLALAVRCMLAKVDKATAYTVVALLLYSAAEVAIFRLMPSVVSLIKPRFAQLWNI
jgi:hypothetical protein